MRCQNERSGSTGYLGKIRKVIVGQTSNTIKRVRINNQRKPGVNKRRRHRHRTARHAHTGTDQSHRTHTGKLCHRRNGVLRQHALGVARQSHHGNLGTLNLHDGHDGLRNRQGYISCSRARGRSGSHHDRSREARRTSHHKHRTTRELIDIIKLRRNIGEIILKIGAPCHGIRIDDQALGLFRKRRHHNGAAHITARIGQKTRLEGNHGNGHIRNDTRTFRVTRLGVQARRYIHRKHPCARFVKRLNPNVKRSADFSVKAGTQHTVQNGISC